MNINLEEFNHPPLNICFGKDSTNVTYRFGLKSLKNLIKNLYIRHFLGMCLKKCSIFFLLLFVNLSISPSSTYTDQECLFCHGKPNISQITQEGKVRSLFVNPEEWYQDIHHKGKIECVDCHINANPYIHFREGLINVDCARCHPEESEEYQKNIHLSFTPYTIQPNKELPLCFHCHTRHHVLPHDNPLSTIHERNVGATCGECHAEIMVKEILKGTSLGKVSGHRKGDLAERFDMKVCISCHYEDAAHGAKRIYKDFCSRCHNVRMNVNLLIGPTHLDSQRWTIQNYIGGALTFLLLIGACFLIGYKSKKRIVNKIKRWHTSMKIDKSKAPKTESIDQEKNESG